MHPPLPANATDDDIADAMVADLLAHRPLRDLTPLVGDNRQRAYELQDAYRDALVARQVRLGMIGYKLGRNGPAHRLADGTRGSVSAPIFSDQCLDSGGRLDLSVLMNPALEFELCAVMADTVPLEGGPYDRHSIAPYIRQFVPALEVLDLRGIKPADIATSTLIGHGVFGAGMVLGEGGIDPLMLDAETLPCVVTIDGRQVAATVGAAPEHPLDAVAWLANHLATRYRRLEPGMLVLCGTHLAVMPITPSQHVTLEMGLAGAVSVVCG